jgi:enterochelin esterase family protein
MKKPLAVASLLFVASAVAQAGPPPTITTHGVHANRSVTFRYYGPGAKRVGLSLDIYAKPLLMTQDGRGVWSVTTPVLPPGVPPPPLLATHI